MMMMMVVMMMMMMMMIELIDSLKWPVNTPKVHFVGLDVRKFLSL
jgi:uncharacterized membrane protein